jgi:hypothetical protein
VEIKISSLFVFCFDREPSISQDVFRVYPSASVIVCLTTESVEGLSLSLEGVDDVHGRDGLTAGVLGVGDGVADDVLEEDLEDTTGLFVDQSGDTLDTTSTRKTTDGGLSNTLDVITKDLSVTLGSSLSESLSSFSSARHGVCLVY